MVANTTFTSGNTYTALQANNFPRGLMATPASSTTNDTSITVEKLQLSYSFAAVSGRNYLLVYVEPAIFGSAVATMRARIRESTSAYGITGTILNEGDTVMSTTLYNTVRTEVIYTATASGTYYIVATLQAGAGTGQAQRSGPTTTKIPQFYAIDIGAGY